MNNLFVPATGLERIETALTKCSLLFGARHWLRVFTDPEYREEYNTTPAFGEVKVHISVATSLY